MHVFRIRGFPSADKAEWEDGAKRRQCESLHKCHICMEQTTPKQMEKDGRES